MPPPREQPPPARNRRRPEPAAPGSWLWLVLLLGLVFVLLFTVGMGGGASIPIDDFYRIAQAGTDKAARKNTNIKKVLFVGPERIEGEVYENARLPDDPKNLRSRRFSTLVPQADITSGEVTRILRESYVSYARQEETGAWIPQLLMLLLPALLLLGIFFFFLLPRFRDPLGGGFLSN